MAPRKKAAATNKNSTPVEPKTSTRKSASGAKSKKVDKKPEESDSTIIHRVMSNSRADEYEFHSSDFDSDCEEKSVPSKQKKTTGSDKQKTDDQLVDPDAFAPDSSSRSRPYSDGERAWLFYCIGIARTKIKCSHEDCGKPVLRAVLAVLSELKHIYKLRYPPNVRHISSLWNCFKTQDRVNSLNMNRHGLSWQFVG